MEPKLLVTAAPGLLRLTLNRPARLNALDLEMVERLDAALDRAEQDRRVRLVILDSSGPSFCAGGDLKAMYQALREGDPDLGRRFFSREYALDLRLHRFPKPVLAMAGGVCMGGGLGLFSAAWPRVADETIRMAMPETRIGFFPDTGATGWLQERLPPGWPEYLALTGLEVRGAECARLSLATHLVPGQHRPPLAEALEKAAPKLSSDKKEALTRIEQILAPFAQAPPAGEPGLDPWVAEYFHNPDSVCGLIASLKTCTLFSRRCAGVFERLSERSPTAVALTLALLRLNRGRDLAEVFARDLDAALFLVAEPDYREGVRARLIDRDDQPRWRPARFEQVRLPRRFSAGQCPPSGKNANTP